MATPLERAPFTTSRLLEFFSEKELQLQIGHPRQLWPLAMTKELIDNALDACETAGVSPLIRVTVDTEVRTVAVQDNGPGLPDAVIERALDYAVRVSTNAYYVSPTRGQLGNALKCVWAAPYVLDGDRGVVEVITHRARHHVEVSLDRIAQRPDVRHTVPPDGLVRTGTIVRVHWPEEASFPSTAAGGDLYNLLWSYAGLNPHATFWLTDAAAPEAAGGVFSATAPEGWPKWLPTSPTAPAWYDPDRLRALIGAYVTAERTGGRAHTVRSFLTEFAGLSGTAKQKTITAHVGLSGAYLRDLVRDGREIDRWAANELLVQMQAAAREVKPAALGVIGEAHLRGWMAGRSVAPDSIKYKRIVGITGQEHDFLRVPYVVEAALGVNTPEYSGCRRRVVAGVNWSPGLPGARFPVPELEELLGRAEAKSWDPIEVVLHVACPLPGTSDRGKTTVALPEEALRAVRQALEAVTKGWTAKKRQHARDGRLQERELEELRRSQRRSDVSIKEAAYAVMPQAYLEAAGGLQMANARQIMYSARPKVRALTEHNTGPKIWKKSSYFTQTLLNDYIEEHPEETREWNVEFDARGHLIEPHTGHQLGIGTAEVRQYVRSWTGEVAVDTTPGLDLKIPTMGPDHRYRFALFVEKEGFYGLFRAAKLAERFDVAIMSTKGMSTTASRELVDELSGAGVTVLVLHDFDRYGLGILHFLQTSNHRYQYKNSPRVIDLGFRLQDVEGLERERTEFSSKKEHPWTLLREYGATEAECRFLARAPDTGSEYRWWGERVELNAMVPADRFITWLEGKLTAAGAAKVVPEDAVLADAYRRVRRRVVIQKAIEQAADDYDGGPVEIPDGLRERISGVLEQSPERAWDSALADIAGEEGVA